MLTDPVEVLTRLQAYPNLYTCVDPKWVQKAAKTRAIRVWHPFFESDPSYTTTILTTIDQIIGHLLQLPAPRTATRAQGLCSNTKDGFWSTLTELTQAAKLSLGYPVAFLPERQGVRTPDIEVTTPNGPVYVEITAMHKTWDFNAISAYIHDALDGVQHGYRIGIECPSDTVKIAEDDLLEAATRVQEYIEKTPVPPDQKTQTVYRLDDGRLAVNLRASDAGVPYTSTSTTATFGPSPDKYFPIIMRRIEEKAPQVEEYRPNVVIIELANASSTIGILGGHDASWYVFGPLFRLNELPAKVDLAILTWQGIDLRTWGTARALPNPTSSWATSADATCIYDLIAALAAPAAPPQVSSL